MTTGFGDILRKWRKQRRFSQLALALDANISGRHLSFLESGRAKPSRDMVLRLTRHLDMPKAEVNRTLLAAGLAPAYPTRAPNDTDLLPVHQAVAKLLENHMPYPAIAINRYWTITHANEAAIGLLEETGFGGYTNLLEALASQPPQESNIINWEEAIGLLLARLRTEMSEMGNDPVFAKLLGELEMQFDMHAEGVDIDYGQSIIPTKFRTATGTISLFSSIAQFGTIQDITLEDLKIELMFPMDDASDRYLLQQGQDSFR